jgi:hypothetical protein
MTKGSWLSHNPPKNSLSNIAHLKAEVKQKTAEKRHKIGYARSTPEKRKSAGKTTPSAHQQ